MSSSEKPLDSGDNDPKPPVTPFGKGTQAPQTPDKPKRRQSLLTPLPNSPESPTTTPRGFPKSIAEASQSEAPKATGIQKWTDNFDPQTPKGQVRKHANSSPGSPIGSSKLRGLGTGPRKIAKASATSQERAERSSRNATRKMEEAVTIREEETLQGADDETQIAA